MAKIEETDEMTEIQTEQQTDAPAVEDTPEDDVSIPIPPKTKPKGKVKGQKTDKKGRFQPVPGSAHSVEQDKKARRSWNDDPPAEETAVIRPLVVMFATTLARWMDDPDFLTQSDVDVITDATGRLCNCYQFSPTSSPELAFGLTLIGCMLPGITRKMQRDAEARKVKFVRNEAGPVAPAAAPDNLRHDGIGKNDPGQAAG